MDIVKRAKQVTGCAWKSLHARKAKHLSKWHFCEKTENCLGVSIEASKKSCYECLVFKKKRSYYNMERPKTTYNHLQPPQKHLQPLANNLLSFVCKWCSVMWSVTSPCLVARLCSVSGVLRFLPVFNNVSGLVVVAFDLVYCSLSGYLH